MVCPGMEVVLQVSWNWASS